MVELLVVIAIIGLLVSLLIPSVRRALDLARRSGCQSNVRQMTSAILAYSQDARMNRGGRDGMLPAVRVEPGSWTDLDDGNPACLWLLIDLEKITPDVFVCPGTDDTPANPGDNRFRADTLSYSYISMVEAWKDGSPASLTAVGSRDMSGDLVIIGDDNPRLEFGSTNLEGDEDQNSENHGGDGQVLGLMSNAAIWTESPNYEADNVYHAGGSPRFGRRKDVNDSYLGP